MNELKPCPFCGCNVVDYDVVVRHPLRMNYESLQKLYNMEKTLLIENSERLYKTLSRYVGPDCLGVIKHKDLMKQVKGE